MKSHAFAKSFLFYVLQNWEPYDFYESINVVRTLERRRPRFAVVDETNSGYRMFVRKYISRPRRKWKNVS
jgi:hypothetical protein